MPEPDAPINLRSRVRPRALQALEILVAVALVTAAIAALQHTAPPEGLGVLYLLAVLAIAVRHGQLPALVTAVLSALTLNYLFIEPRHQLSIAHSRDVVELLVLLVAAVVVGRLAATGRRQAAEAEVRAQIATAREREASLLAGVASAILAGRGVAAQLTNIGGRIAGATGASSARIGLEPVPSPRPGELALRVPARARAAWLYVSDDSTWERADIERITEPLGGLLDVAFERERVAAQAAETEAARQADRTRTAILHAISHDLRSPLTAITTAGEALRSTGVTEDERTELIDMIGSEGSRLARLVDDLLDLSKIEAGAVAPRADWCDLRDTVASSAANARTGDHPIELVLPADLPLVRADAAQLERVFSNLVENAVKFSPPGMPVKITAGASGGRVTVRVIDRGRGIPMKDRPHVFEPFFRGRASGGGSGGGSGLGLAICRGFVEANGGQIVLQTGLAEETAFAVSFPLVRQPEAVT
jgi:two-component system sensor histidine kinase KdpD